MRKLELTIIKNISKGGDSDSKITAIGYEEESAKLDAVKALQYACCMDFNSPASCRPGTEVQFFSASGIEVEKGTDEEEIAEEMNWEQAFIMEFDGRHFALPENYDEWRTGGAIDSDTVRKFDSWDDI